MLLRRNTQQLLQHLRTHLRAYQTLPNSCWLQPLHEPTWEALVPSSSPRQSLHTSSTAPSAPPLPNAPNANSTRRIAKDDLELSGRPLAVVALALLDRIWPNTASPALDTLYKTIRHANTQHIDNEAIVGLLRTVHEDLQQQQQQRGGHADLHMLSAALLLLGLTCHANPTAHSADVARKIVHDILDTLSKVQPRTPESPLTQRAPPNWALAMHYGTCLALQQAPEATITMLLGWVWPVLTELKLLDLVNVLRCQSTLLGGGSRGGLPQAYVQQHADVCVERVEETVAACEHASTPTVNAHHLSGLVAPQIFALGNVRWAAEGLLGFAHLQLPSTHPDMCTLAQFVSRHMRKLTPQHANYVCKALTIMRAVPPTFDFEAFGQRMNDLLPTLHRTALSDLLYCLTILGQAPTTLSRELLGAAIMVNTSGAYRVPLALTACHAVGWMPDNVNPNMLMSSIPHDRPIRPPVVVDMLRTCARFACYVSWDNVAPLLAHLPPASFVHDARDAHHHHTYHTHHHPMHASTDWNTAPTTPFDAGVGAGVGAGGINTHSNSSVHNSGSTTSAGQVGWGTPVRLWVTTLHALGVCRVLMPLDVLDRVLGDLAESIIHLPHWLLIQLLHSLLMTYHHSPPHHALVLSFADHCMDTLGHVMLGHAWHAHPPDADAAAKGLLFCIHGPLARQLLESDVLYTRMGAHVGGAGGHGVHYRAHGELLPPSLRMVCEAVLPGGAAGPTPSALEGMEAVVLGMPHVLRDMSMMPTSVGEALVMADVYATVVGTGQRVALRGLLQRLRFAAMPMATGPESVQPLLAEAVGVRLVTLEEEVWNQGDVEMRKQLLEVALGR